MPCKTFRCMLPGHYRKGSLYSILQVGSTVTQGLMQFPRHIKDSIAGEGEILHQHLDIGVPSSWLQKEPLADPAKDINLLGYIYMPSTAGGTNQQGENRFPLEWSL